MIVVVGVVCDGVVDECVECLCLWILVIEYLGLCCVYCFEGVCFDCVGWWVFEEC